MEDCLRLNPAARIHDFDSSSATNTLMVEVPARDGNGCSRYVLPEPLIGLLRQFDGIADTDAIIARHVLGDATHSAEKVKALVNGFLLPKGILVPDQEERALSDLPPKARSYMYFKVTLLNAGIVSFLTARLSWLFGLRTVALLLPLCLFAQFFFFLRILPHYQFDLNHLSGPQFLIVLNVASLFGIVHELGHASALRRFGYKSATIGWGIYLAFAVFFSDLSEAWRLKRTQRAIVDVGGIYFHLLSLTALTGVIIYTRSTLLVYCFFFINLQVVGALNPFLRMDGYWLIADIFGIVDLRKDAVGYVRRLFQRLIGVDHEGIQPEWASNPRNRVVLGAYLGLSLFFSVYIYKLLFAQLAFNILPNYPGLLYNLWMILVHGPRSVGSVVGLSLAVIWKGFALYGFFRMLLSLLRFLWRSLLGASVMVRQRTSQEATNQGA